MKKNGKKSGILVLENGETFYGESFAAKKTEFGEVVFNTSMTGYQEILTDPSYKQQIITLTYPEIGNYGIVPEDNQSRKIHANGLVIKNYNDFYYNPKSSMTLSDYLKSENTIALKNLDTRRLTKIIREQGAMEGVISSKKLDKTKLLNLLKDQPRFSSLDLAKEVSTKKSYWFYRDKKNTINIGVMDFGVKKNILNLLAQLNLNVKVFPLHTPFEKLKENMHGILLSNGPGDPNNTDEEIIKTVTQLINHKIPLFGICFGHQLLMKALGYNIYKLKFGHHGANHPIKNFLNNKTLISSQNHGYAAELKEESKEKEINLNDHTLAGIFKTENNFFSVQYHPEGAPGPEDNFYQFQFFLNMVKKNKKIK